MLNIRYIFLIVIILLVQNQNTAIAQSNSKKYVIIGYFSGSDWTKKEVDVSNLTHINYAFAIPTKDGTLEKLGKRDSTNLRHLVSLREKHGDLKILISIGGWTGCKYFSDAALTDQSRLTFANSCISLLKNFNLDGIDIDWEYPAQIGDNNVFRPEDKQNYTLLLKTLREKLDEQGLKDKRTSVNHYLLTSATGVDSTFISHTEMGEAQKYLDYVNIMTYDIYHGNDKVTGHHSDLYESKKGDQSRHSSDEAVKAYINEGVPVEKIVLGIPFYGRGWFKVTNKENGLYQAAQGKHVFVSYDDLKDNYINKNGYKRYWDDDAKTPFLWDPQKFTFISYNDPEALKYKVEYVKNSDLAGVMFWEFTHDLKNKELLPVLANGLNK